MADIGEVLEAIESALESEDYERALQLANDAVRANPTDPLLRAAYGDALLELGDLEDARDAYHASLELDPNDPDTWFALAQVQFQRTEFEETREAAQRCLALEDSADALDLLSRLAERDGEVQKADELMARANALDSEFVVPSRVDETEFRALVQTALEDIPQRFRDALDGDVAIFVEPVPLVEILRSEKPPLDPGLLGLYYGTPLPDRDQPTVVTALPDRIFLFQHNLEHVVDNRDDLVEQIRITLFHEVGHYFGFSDEELEERDFG